MELFDVLDVKGNLTGVTAAKGTPLNNGQYYLGTHAYIYNSSIEFLIQQRAYNKTFLPGGWDVHLEHAIAGETSVDCVCRGMLEEVGLLLDTVNITLPQKFVWHDYKHIVDVYFIQTNFDLTQLSLHSDEVINVKIIPKNEMIKLVANMDYRPIEYRNFVMKKISSF
jgi:isopentenyldiphosphate isomerase